MLEPPVYGTVSGNPSFIISLKSAKEKASEPVTGESKPSDKPAQPTLSGASPNSPSERYKHDEEMTKISTDKGQSEPKQEVSGHMNGPSSTNHEHADQSKPDAAKEVARQTAAPLLQAQERPQVGCSCWQQRFVEAACPSNALHVLQPFLSRTFSAGHS